MYSHVFLHLFIKQRFPLLPIFSSSPSNPLYSIPPGHPSTHTPYHHTPPTPPTVTTSHWSAHPCHPQQYRLSVGIPRKSSSCADIRSTNPSSVRNPVARWPTEESPKLIHISLLFRQSEYAVHTTLDTVDYALGREPSSSLDRTPHYCKKKHGGFAQFVWRMICTSRVSVAVVLVALIYIKRAKPHLRITAERWACERIFVGALVLAGKVSFTSFLVTSVMSSF